MNGSSAAIVAWQVVQATITAIQPNGECPCNSVCYLIAKNGRYVITKQVLLVVGQNGKCLTGVMRLVILNVVSALTQYNNALP